MGGSGDFIFYGAGIHYFSIAAKCVVQLYFYCLGWLRGWQIILQQAVLGAHLAFCTYGFGLFSRLFSRQFLGEPGLAAGVFCGKLWTVLLPAPEKDIRNI